MVWARPFSEETDSTDTVVTKCKHFLLFQKSVSVLESVDPKGKKSRIGIGPKNQDRSTPS